MRPILSHIQSKNLHPEGYKIYYIFAFLTVGRPIIPFLRKLGLNCTEPKNNPALGTVSTIIFFENVELELFWLNNHSDLAQLDTMAEFNLFARLNWLETGASPFGFGLCPRMGNDDLFTAQIESKKTNKTQIFRQHFPLSAESVANPDEPIVYVVPNYVANASRLDRVWNIDEQIVTQSLEMRQLTRIKLQVSSERISTTPLLNLVAQNILDIEYGKHPLLELAWDDNNRQKRIDLRPLLPIVLRA